MKRAVAFVLSFMLIFSMLAMPAGAAVNKEVKIPEVGISFRAPDRFYIFTPNMDENDPIFEEFSFASMIAMFLDEGQGLYMVGITADYRNVLMLLSDQNSSYKTVDMQRLTVADMAQYQENLIESLSSAAEAEEVRDIEMVMMDTPNVYRFARITATMSMDGGEEAAMIAYCTFIEDRQYIFSVVKYDGVFLETEISELDEMINSVVYGDDFQGTVASQPQSVTSNPETANTSTPDNINAGNGTGGGIGIGLIIVLVGLGVVIGVFVMLTMQKRKSKLKEIEQSNYALPEDAQAPQENEPDSQPLNWGVPPDILGSEEPEEKPENWAAPQDVLESKEPETKPENWAVPPDILGSEEPEEKP